MRATARFCFVCIFLFAATYRLPAPIVEEEKPTPAPAAKPRPKRTAETKSNRAAQTSTTKSTPTPVPSKKFAGTWSGIMPEVPWGNIQTELIVDPTETTMEWRDSLSSKHGTAKATLAGETLSALFPGWPRPVWSITPDPGGKTAHVRLQAFMNDDHSVFRRVSQ